MGLLEARGMHHRKHDGTLREINPGDDSPEISVLDGHLSMAEKEGFPFRGCCNREKLVQPKFYP